MLLALAALVISSRVLLPRAVEQFSATDLVTLVGSLVWPTCVLIIVLYFSKPITTLIENLKSATLKAGGVELGIERQQSTLLASQLTQADAAVKAGSGADLADPSDIAARAVALTSPGTAAAFRSKRILWLVDRTSKARFLIQAFQTLGIGVTYRTDVSDAAQLAKASAYDAIISSLVVGDDKRAGYAFLQAAGTRVPFFLFTQDPTVDAAEASSLGVTAVTKDPNALFRAVTDVLRGAGRESSQ